MQRTPSLPSLLGPHWLGVLAPGVLSMGQIDLNCNYAKLNCLTSTVSFPSNCVNKKTVKSC